MKTNQAGEESGGKRQEQAERLERIRMTDLDLALSVLERVRVDVLSCLEDKASKELVPEVRQAVMHQLKEENAIAELVAAEASKRTKALLGIVSGVALVLGLIGFQSITPLVEYKAEQATAVKVREAFERQREELNELRKLLVESGQQIVDQRAKAVDSFRAEIATELRAAQRQWDSDIAQAKKAIEDERNVARTRIGEDGKQQEERLRGLASEASTSVRDAVASAEKNLQASVTDAIKTLARARVAEGKTSEGGGSLGLEGHVDRGGKGTAKEDEDLVLEAAVQLDQREFDDVVALAMRLGEANRFDEARAALGPVILNPERFSPDLEAAGKVLLHPNRSSADRAQQWTDVLICGLRGNSPALRRMATNELASNPLARLTKSPFDEFVLAVNAEEGIEALKAKFEKIEFEKLTGLGLANLLFLSKKAKLPEESLEQIERRLVNAVRSTEIIDRSGDYALSWLIVRALQTPPLVDPAGLRPVVQRVEQFVFDDEHRDLDPWKLKEMLDRVPK